MRTLTLLLMAGIALTGVANAQVVRDPPPDPRRLQQQTWGVPSVWSTTTSKLEIGVRALQAGNFVKAEAIFADYVRHDRPAPDVYFYLGVARMSLGKWEDAKKNLEVAVTKMPWHPDPKSRLAVTYAKLGDIAGANAQRAELVKMIEACEGACEFLPYIRGGIQMIDQALAEASLSFP